MRSLNKILSTLETFLDVQDSYDLKQLLIDGKKPNGETYNEKERAHIISALCEAVYYARDEVMRIVAELNNI